MFHPTSDPRCKIDFPRRSGAEPLTLEEAIDVFDQLADMPDIAFGHTDSGCTARAHIMCRRLMDAGIKAGKAWAFGKKRGDGLKVAIPEGETREWWFHVASTMEVIMQNGGSETMIIDPSLFDGPVTVDEWGGLMNASPDKLQLKDFGIAPDGYNGDYAPHEKTDENTDRDAALIMDEDLREQSRNRRIVFPSHSRGQLALNRQNTGEGITGIFRISGRGNVAMEGRTWVSSRQTSYNRLSWWKERLNISRHG